MRSPCEASESLSGSSCLSTSNAGSLPPRLPSLSTLLNQLESSNYLAETTECYTLVALSYRGYWTSDGRPSQKGIEKDAAAVLDWISDRKVLNDHPTTVTLWGQSIGAGIAMTAAARYLNGRHNQLPLKRRPSIQKILLETPFLSIRDMLSTIYPQRWLPYRYLWPFLTNQWDIGAASRTIALIPRTEWPEILILQAGMDELVPREHGSYIERLLLALEFKVHRIEVSGALHTEILSRKVGQKHIVQFIKKIPTLV